MALYSGLCGLLSAIFSTCLCNNHWCAISSVHRFQCRAAGIGHHPCNPSELKTHACDLDAGNGLDGEGAGGGGGVSHGVGHVGCGGASAGMK